MATQREIEQALIATEGPIKKAFLDAVSAVVTAGSITIISQALDDYETILDNVGLNQAALNDTLEQIRESFKSGGKFEAPSARITFDIRNERAEQWLREESARFVREINRQQREAIRQAIETGTRLGQNPRQTALDIIGRMGSTGRRTGGIVGLSETQAGYVSNTRQQLLSGDPKAMRQYFQRTRRDRRFDAIVQRAIDAGKPVSRADMERLTGRYSDRLLQTRGEAIARTEALQAFSAARDQAYNQAIDEGKIAEQNIEKTWRSSGDGRVRHTHASLNGQTVPKSGLFRSPSGAMMAHPGDTSHGAPASEIVHCRCGALYKVDFFAEANRG